MSRTDILVALFGIATTLVACSSSSTGDGDANEGGSGAAGSGGALIGAGAGGPYGNGEPPAGGAVAQAAWAVEACDLLMAQGCPPEVPVPAVAGRCNLLPVRVYPDANTCGPVEEREMCVPVFYLSPSFACPMLCANEASCNGAVYRTLPNGEVAVRAGITDPKVSQVILGFDGCGDQIGPDVCQCHCVP